MSVFQHHVHGRRRRHSLAVAFAAFLCLSGGFAACGGSSVTPTAASSVTAAPTESANTSTETVIELTSEGFVPDRVEVSKGTRLVLHNATSEQQSVVVKGRDFKSPDDDGITIEAGQSLDLNVHQLGAYVLTLGDDPQITASVFIS